MTAGTQVAPETASSFQKNVSTFDEVVGRLGEPQRVATAADGSRTAVYSYAQTKIRPESFIPYVGLLAGGSDTDTTSVLFRFDAKGRLIDYSSVKGHAGAGYGLEGIQ